MKLGIIFVAVFVAFCYIMTLDRMGVNCQDASVNTTKPWNKTCTHGKKSRPGRAVSISHDTKVKVNGASASAGASASVKKDTGSQKQKNSKQTVKKGTNNKMNGGVHSTGSPPPKPNGGSESRPSGQPPALPPPSADASISISG